MFWYETSLAMLIFSTYKLDKTKQLQHLWNANVIKQEPDGGNVSAQRIRSARSNEK